MEGNTVFISYILVPSGITTGSYSQAIHCNYIKKIDLGGTDPYVQEVSLSFPTIDVTDFKFLTSGATIGYSVNKIHALVQIVSNAQFNSFDEVVPESHLWKQLDITKYQVKAPYVQGNPLTGADLVNQVFKISLLHYPDNPATTFTQYDLDYINYPSSEDNLVFGDVTYFFGNVETMIKADVYTTDISINLRLNEFNSTSNKTWDGVETVYISEVGIYDSNKNLVAIGKLNDPVAKDYLIARTIVFNLDFSKSNFFSFNHKNL